jgi:NAD(P)-dependent dehydrogenase (short-subunit alcohol dehydrogenase family)
VMATPFGRTTDGFEMQFGTNHLGHFLLTNLLAPSLAEAPSARVVTLTSAGHSMGNVRFDDPQFDRGDYDPWAAYGQSKTANILFTVALDQRISPDVRAFAVHPGGIHTDLGRYMTPELIGELRNRLASAPDAHRFRWKSIPQGAATTVYAAVSDDLRNVGGVYLADCAVQPVKDDANPSGVESYAVDPAAAQRLWELSETLVGQSFAR